MESMSSSSAVQGLLHVYHSYEQTLPLYHATNEHAALTRFNGNREMPVHNWFMFKEGFSANLLSWICNDLPFDLNKAEAILDPFCGVGTSLLSAQLAYQGNHHLLLIGVERNPFIHFAAQAKLKWPCYRVSTIRELKEELLYSLGNFSNRYYPVPALSTIQNHEVFAANTVQDLLAYRQRIEDACEDRVERDFFMLGWAAIIEKVSGVRKYGRGLRFAKKPRIPTVVQALEDQWNNMLRDLEIMQQERTHRNKVYGRIILGDGRILPLNDESFDLIVYSPPYLNNIDYSEVYKLELWFSGYIIDQNGFRELRRATLRSHPSIRFPETRLLDTLSEKTWPRQLRETMLATIPDDNNRMWRERLICGYLDDMYQSLLEQFRVAVPGAPIICVVGNSLHGRHPHPILIATDLLICALAQTVGFAITRLQVARYLSRRQHNDALLRESIIIMRKPKR